MTRRTPSLVVARFAAILLGFGYVAGAATALAVFGIFWWPFSLVGLGTLTLASWWTSPGRRFDPHRWRVGLEGETQVGWTIQELRAFGFEVIEGVMGSSGNVDHIVVGPTGAFAIETKRWTGRVEFRDGVLVNNGRSCSRELRQTMHNAIAIREACGDEVGRCHPRCVQRHRRQRADLPGQRGRRQRRALE